MDFELILFSASNKTPKHRWGVISNYHLIGMCIFFWMFIIDHKELITNWLVTKKIFWISLTHASKAEIITNLFIIITNISRQWRHRHVHERSEHVDWMQIYIYLYTYTINSWCVVYHYCDGIMSSTVSQITTSLKIVYSIVYSGTDQSSASLAFVRGIHRRLVTSRHKWPVMRKMFPFDDVIMCSS